jgi:hypothetical protein
MKCGALMFVLLLAGVVDVAALDLEFEGFTHLRNWNGFGGDISLYSHPFVLSNGQGIPIPVQKDICALDGKCGIISEYDGSQTPGPQMLGGNMRTRTYNSTTDVYLCHDKSVLENAKCQLEKGGAYVTNQEWLACTDDFGNMWAGDNTLNTYDIPPALLYSTCLNESKCVGIRVRNDKSGGDLLKSTDDIRGYFLISSD